MEQRVDLMIDSCLCRQCPTWIDCGEQGAYCATAVGKSRCITRENGCICGGCPVTTELGLKHGFYCTRGSEADQTK